MGTHTVKEITNSIRMHLTEPDHYSVILSSSHCYLMQTDGDGLSAPVLSVDAGEIFLHKKSPRRIKSAIRDSLRDLGYTIPFKPAKIGGGSLYLYKNNAATSQ